MATQLVTVGAIMIEAASPDSPIWSLIYAQQANGSGSKLPGKGSLSTGFVPGKKHGFILLGIVK